MVPVCIILLYFNVCKEVVKRLKSFWLNSLYIPKLCLYHHYSFQYQCLEITEKTLHNTTMLHSLDSGNNSCPWLISIRCGLVCHLRATGLISKPPPTFKRLSLYFPIGFPYIRTPVVKKGKQRAREMFQWIKLLPHSLEDLISVLNPHKARHSNVSL